MSRTVDMGFRDLLHEMVPSHPESESSKAFYLSIKDCLATKYGLVDFFKAGSSRNRTGVPGCSIHDYFAVIPNKRLKSDSTATVSEIKNLLSCHLNHADVQVVNPGIRVSSGTEVANVIPADYVEDVDGCKTYDVPDYSGGWMKASPDAHGAYIKTIEQQLGAKVKNLIRLVKAWKYCSAVPISSFYLELAVARYLEEKSSVIYDVDVQGVLSSMFNNEIAPILDPMSVSGFISPCMEHSESKIIKSELTSALIRANKALDARFKYNIAEAYEWWKMLYNGKFPGYYE